MPQNDNPGPNCLNRCHNHDLPPEEVVELVRTGLGIDANQVVQWTHLDWQVEVQEYITPGDLPSEIILYCGCVTRKMAERIRYTPSERAFLPCPRRIRLSVVTAYRTGSRTHCPRETLYYSGRCEDCRRVYWSERDRHVVEVIGHD